MGRQILDKSSWIKSREKIKNSYECNKYWESIIEKFVGRITDFYFKPIERVKEINSLKGEGFTILTIQCALIEMFASFRLGKIHNHKKKSSDPSYEYKYSHECFISFLQNQKIFEKHFFTIMEDETKTINKPFDANEFYDKVRCGLMHEARTKGNWYINAKENYIGTETTFITRNDTGDRISIDRTILNNQLKKYFKEYENELLSNNEEGKQLRRLFARKLDHLYDIPADKVNYEWWEDY